MFLQPNQTGPLWVGRCSMETDTKPHWWQCNLFFFTHLYQNPHRVRLCYTNHCSTPKAVISEEKENYCCFGLTAAEARFQNERTGLLAQSIHAGQPVVNVSRNQRKQHTLRISGLFTRQQTLQLNDAGAQIQGDKILNWRTDVSQRDLIGNANMWCVALFRKIGSDLMGVKNTV